MSVTLHFRDTPFAAAAWPELRPGGLHASLLDAFIGVDGVVPRRTDLTHPDLVCVTTGQQPGLFTGPAYTIHKALSARALALLLEARWQRPVVPVFWLATDDHDFSEATHAAWVTSDGTLRAWASPPRPADAPLTPMYREPLPPDTAEALAQLESDLGGTEFLPDVIAWLRRHYRTGVSVGSAYTGALAEMLAPLGIACFDPTHPSARRMMAPWLLRAAEGTGPLDRALAARISALRASGADPGVSAGQGATLVMLEGVTGRDRLVATADGYRTRRGGEVLTRAELRSIGAEEPVRLSPNVLLRPVIEAAILPTVAYVAGPGELRYLAATGPVYESLQVRPQHPVPRWSGLVIEPFVDRTLPKLGLELDTVLDDPDGAAARVARHQMPTTASAALLELREAVTSHYARLAQDARGIDPTLVRTMQGLQGRGLRGVEQAEQKLVRALRRRDSDASRQVRRLIASLRPGGAPQERTLTVATWLARYGPAFTTTLAEAVLAWYRRALEPLQPLR